MFYEYALEPAVLSGWDRTRFFLDSFGPWKGRFLAEYPRQWKRMVFDGLRCPDVERKRVVERLSKLKRCVFSARVGATYDGAKPWLDNAEVEHARQPFRAIVAAGAHGKPHVLDGAEVDEQSELWRVDGGRLVPRDPSRFVEALALLLRVSSRVVLVDPYFRADQDNKTRPVVEFCKFLAGYATVEVHFSDQPRSYGQCMSDAERVLPRILPRGTKVELRCWKQRTGGPRLHNRYVLSDVGGVKFGDGIEVGDAGHQDHLSILDEPSRVTLWEQYVGATPAFDPAGPPLVLTGRGGQKRR